MKKMLLVGLSLIAVMTSCGGAMTTTYTATLLGVNEVPPVVTSGNTAGNATATLDLNTNVLTVNGTYGYLSGQVTAQHIHGPAAAGVNANPPIFTLTNTATAAQGSFTGTFTLTASEISDLNNGLYYINLHTAINPNGEVRGQLIK